MALHLRRAPTLDLRRYPLLRQSLLGPRTLSRIDVGEDSAFIWSPEPKRVAIKMRDELYVAIIHRGNTSPKNTTGQRWRELPALRLEALLRVAGDASAGLTI